MEFQPVDLPELMGVILGISIVLIPIAGWTLRFAVKPLVDALLQAGVIGARGQSNDAELGRLSRRVLELEQQVERMRARELTPVQDERKLEGASVVDLPRLRT